MHIFIYILKGLLNFLYSFLKLLPTQKKILFLSRQDNNPSIDINMLVNEITKCHPDYKTVVLCKKLNRNISSLISYSLHILKQMFYLATSQAVIIDSYAIPVSLLKHKSTLLVIQMWHSMGTMKKFAYSILDKPEGTSSKIAKAMNMHKNYDYILCAGNGYKSHLAEGFNYPESKIIVLPLPRMDLLKDKNYIEETKNKIYKSHPELLSKKNILYVPTFRKTETEKKEFKNAVKNLKKAIIPYENDFNLIIKAHPLSEIDSPYSDFSSFEMLSVSDYVISDYSCIIYEAAILQKPLYFYAYDYERYINHRDLYIDYPNEIPGPIYEDPCKLIKHLSHSPYDMDRLNHFLKKYIDYKQCNVTKKIVEFIWSKLY